MKKYILFVLLLLSAALFYRSIPAYAVEIETKTEYVLPYPGMLADNPLYFLKKFRDTILEKLIADPIRKIEFYVLQSDKELSAAMLLDAKGNQALVTASCTQSAVYMEQAIKKATDMKSQGIAIPGYIIEKLGSSLTKHEEVVSGFIDKLTDGQKAELTAALELFKSREVDVAALK